VPPFALDGSRYDQSTYEGRVLGFLDVVDPRMLVVSEREQEVSGARRRGAGFKQAD
jgi:hypothetical protein